MENLPDIAKLLMLAAGVLAVLGTVCALILSAFRRRAMKDIASGVLNIDGTDNKNERRD